MPHFTKDFNYGLPMFNFIKTIGKIDSECLKNNISQE